MKCCSAAQVCPACDMSVLIQNAAATCSQGAWERQPQASPKRSRVTRRDGPWRTLGDRSRGLGSGADRIAPRKQSSVDVPGILLATARRALVAPWIEDDVVGLRWPWRREKIRFFQGFVSGHWVLPCEEPPGGARGLGLCLPPGDRGSPAIKCLRHVLLSIGCPPRVRRAQHGRPVVCVAFPENTKPARLSQPSSIPSTVPCVGPARSARWRLLRDRNAIHSHAVPRQTSMAMPMPGDAHPFAAQQPRPIVANNPCPVARWRMDHFPLSAAKTPAHERPWPLRASRWITKPSTTAAPPSAAEKAKRLPRIPRPQDRPGGPLSQAHHARFQKPCLLSSLEHHRPPAANPHRRRRRWRSPHSFTPNVRSLLLHYHLPAVPRTTLTTVLRPPF